MSLGSESRKGGRRIVPFFSRLVVSTFVDALYSRRKRALVARSSKYCGISWAKEPARAMNQKKYEYHWRSRLAVLQRVPTTQRTPSVFKSRLMNPSFAAQER